MNTPIGKGRILRPAFLVSGRGPYVLVELLEGVCRIGGYLRAESIECRIRAIEGVRATELPLSTVGIGLVYVGPMEVFEIGQMVEFHDSDGSS